MKQFRLRLITLAGGPLLLSGCFITNAIGFPPPGSYTGLEVKQALGERGFLNFYLGAYAFCEQFSNSQVCREAAGKEIQNGAALSSYLAPYKVAEIERIENDSIYTGQSAEECVSKVGTGIFLTANVLATNNLVKDTAGNIADESIRFGLELAGPIAAIIAAENCREILEEPGPLIYLGRTDKIFDDDGGDDDGEEKKE